MHPHVVETHPSAAPTRPDRRHERGGVIAAFDHSLRDVEGRVQHRPVSMAALVGSAVLAAAVAWGAAEAAVAATAGYLVYRALKRRDERPG